MTKMISNSMYGNKISAIITDICTRGNRPVMPKDSKYSAIVTDISDNSFELYDGSIKCKALKAVSCLIEPKIGDEVLLFNSVKSGLYITDILSTKIDSAIEIVAKNGMSIKTKDSSLSLVSDNAILVNANEANVVITKVNFLTKITTFKSETLNIISSFYNGIIEHFNMKNESATHRVSGHNELQCNSSRKIVKHSDITNVKDSVLIAHAQVKIDADKINMG